jgi:hypothetical protein
MYISNILSLGLFALWLSSRWTTWSSWWTTTETATSWRASVSWRAISWSKTAAISAILTTAVVSSRTSGRSWSVWTIALRSVTLWSVALWSVTLWSIALWALVTLTTAAIKSRSVGSGTIYWSIVTALAITLLLSVGIVRIWSWSAWTTTLTSSWSTTIATLILRTVTLSWRLRVVVLFATILILIVASALRIRLAIATAAILLLVWRILRAGDRCARWSGHVGGLEALLALHNIKLNLLILTQAALGLVRIVLDYGGLMHKDVLVGVVTIDETVTVLDVEPLNNTSYFAK